MSPASLSHLALSLPGLWRHAWMASARRGLYAMGLVVALFACFPLAADASEASVQITGAVPTLKLLYKDTSDTANKASIETNASGEYLIKDERADITPKPGCVRPVETDTHQVTCTFTGVRAIDVTLGDGSDELTIVDAAYPPGPPPFGVALVTVDGGLGSDTIVGGAGPDDFVGGADDDVMTGGAGDDRMSGGVGADTLDGGAGAERSISGGAGEDTVLGGPDDDRGLAGGDDNDRVIDGGDGNDDVRGGDGADTVRGGAGDDRLDTPVGNEQDPTGGPDTLEGGPGDDEINGGPAGTPQDPDVVSGGDGTDTADFSWRTAHLIIDLDGDADDGESGEGDNVRPDVEKVIGGSESDHLTGSDAANTLDGMGGEDMLEGRAGDDALLGGMNDDAGDALRGEAGSDMLTGGQGEDSLTGGEDDDALLGGGGADALDGERGGDTLEGGPGGDALDGGAGNDSLNGGAAILVGADGDDRLNGGRGVDQLFGGRGNDMLDGGPNADSMSGEDGKDTVTYEDRTHPVFVSLNGIADDGEIAEGDNVAADVEVIVGGEVDDTLSGNADANLLAGGRGEDLIEGGRGRDLLTGGKAPDLLKARDGAFDVVKCEDDEDLAIVDRNDAVRSCDTVDQPGARRLRVGRDALVRSQGEFGLRLPDGSRFFSLTEEVKIPIGSTIDPQAGVVRLATATSRAGARRVASVSAGRFSVRQQRGRRPATKLRLAGKLPDCQRSSAGRGGPPPSARRLRVDIVKKQNRSAPYSVRGHYSVGGAYGTEWITEDRCDGTLTTVISGAVRVRDFGRERTVTVRPGKPYLAAR